jgi:hypothetical protein
MAICNLRHACATALQWRLGVVGAWVLGTNRRTQKGVRQCGGWCVTLAFLGWVSMSTIAGSDHMDDLSQLTTIELLQLLPGSVLSQVQPARDQGRTHFRCDGTYQRVTRVTTNGRYEIRDGQYCLEGTCYRLFRNGAGEHFAQMVGSDPRTVRPIGKVSVSKAENCR